MSRMQRFVAPGVEVVDDDANSIDVDAKIVKAQSSRNPAAATHREQSYSPPGVVAAVPQ